VWTGANTGVVRRGVRGAPAVNYGEASTLASNVSWAANYLIGIPVTISSQADVTSLSTILKGAGGNVNLALYTDAAGAPGNFIAQTGAFTMPGAGTYTRAIPQVTLQPGQYWIVQISDYSGTPTGSESAGGPGYRYVIWPYVNGFPAVAPATGQAGTYRLNYFLSGFNVP